MARGEKLAELLLKLSHILFPTTATRPGQVPVPDGAELARRSAQIDGAMRGAKQIRSEAIWLYRHNK